MALPPIRAIALENKKSYKSKNFVIQMTKLLL